MFTPSSDSSLGIDLMPNVDDGYAPLHTEDDEDGIDIGFHRIPLNNTKKEDENANENIEDFKAHEEKGEEKKDNKEFNFW
jgi:hypothetical protein